MEYIQNKFLIKKKNKINIRIIKKIKINLII